MGKRPIGIGLDVWFPERANCQALKKNTAKTIPINVVRVVNEMLDTQFECLSSTRDVMERGAGRRFQCVLITGNNRFSTALMSSE